MATNIGFAPALRGGARLQLPRSVALAYLLALTADCASDTMQSPGVTPPACQPGTLGCNTPAGGSMGLPMNTAGNGMVGLPIGGGVSTGGAVAPDPGMAGTGAPAPTMGSGVPCDVAPIVSENCTGCHRSPTINAAPMPLLTAADFQAAAKSDPTKKVHQVIPTRLDPTDPAKRMPPAPLDALSAADKSTLNAWLAAGAPAAASSCAVAIKDVPMVGGEEPGMTPVGGGSGGAHITPIEYNDPEMKCYKFQSHARGDKTKPWSQPVGEQYINFDFKAPWEGMQYLRASKIANDPNSRVLHHWLLFKLSGPATDGATATGSGIHPSATLVHAFGPGASPIYLDPDVGFPMEGSVGYELEVHFNNSGGGSGEDMSGAEVCVTPKKPDKIVDLVWVGSDSIAGTSAQGSCRPTGPFPIHIIAAQPHMHKLGTHMKVVVNRAGGMQEVVHDEDFSFDSQIYYIKDIVLNQGDTMNTTCTYSGFATFGQSTSNEMCYFFSLAWPAGSLRSAGGNFIHGPATCM